jgi:hypothetical protein
MPYRYIRNGFCLDPTNYSTDQEYWTWVEVEWVCDEIPELEIASFKAILLNSKQI